MLWKWAYLLRASCFWHTIPYAKSKFRLEGIWMQLMLAKSLNKIPVWQEQWLRMERVWKRRIVIAIDKLRTMWVQATAYNNLRWSSESYDPRANVRRVAVFESPWLLWASHPRWKRSNCQNNSISADHLHQPFEETGPIGPLRSNSREYWNHQLEVRWLGRIHC